MQHSRKRLPHNDPTFSTEITEKVYAQFLPETLSSEVERLAPTISEINISSVVK